MSRWLLHATITRPAFLKLQRSYNGLRNCQRRIVFWYLHCSAKEIILSKFFRVPSNRCLCRDLRVVKLWHRIPTPPLDVFKRQLDSMLSELFPDAPWFASSPSLSLQFTVSTIIHNHNNVIPLPDNYVACDFCCDPLCHEASVTLSGIRWVTFTYVIKGIDSDKLGEYYSDINITLYPSCIRCVRGNVIAKWFRLWLLLFRHSAKSSMAQNERPATSP